MSSSMVVVTVIITALLGIGVGFGGGLLLKLWWRTKADQKADAKVDNAQATAEQIINNAQEKAAATIKEMQAEAKAVLLENQKQNALAAQALAKRENNLLEREQIIDDRFKALTVKNDNLNSLKEEYQLKIDEQLKKIEQLAQLSQGEAKQILMIETERQINKDLSKMIRMKRDHAQMRAKKIATEIIVNALERYASDTVIENTVNQVVLPSDEMKGRIIGKDGRNIKTFELVSGVDLIIDDTPNTIRLSSFNPLRREVATRTLNALIKDGRIQPVRIEETYQQQQQAVEAIIEEKGQTAVDQLALTEMDPHLIYFIGRLYFRTSYGQNSLQHALEVARLASSLAAELDLDTALARRAGLLHDIGKAIDYELAASHVQVGVQLAKKYGENEIVTNTIASHHGDEPPTSVYAVLVSTADTLSAARPGSRNNNYEEFAQRMDDIEAICMAVKGVKTAYAVQAGRQIRVIVDPQTTTEAAVYKITKTLQEELANKITVPGDVILTVIRETRNNVKIK